MKILLHGYLNETNFGDILFADLFYRKCLELKFDAVDFLQLPYYKMGSFCRKNIGYTAKKPFLSALASDAYVMISGGCLGDDSNANGKTARKRFFRFVLPARLFELLGKPVYVLGVGGGPVDSPWLRRQMVKMLDAAAVIQFRDAETKRYFEEYGVKNTMTVTSDTAQVIVPEMLPAFEQKQELDALAAGRKKLFLHLSENDHVNEEILRRVVPGVLQFLKAHPDYIAAVSFDNVRVKDPKARLRGLEAVKLLREQTDVFLYDYHDCWQLCALLNEMDCIVTQKLHVGVIGAALGRSVVSFPVHREKTQRYYRQIGQEERCVHMSMVTPEIVCSQMERFCGQPITLPAQIRAEAARNLSVLEGLEK